MDGILLREQALEYEGQKLSKYATRSIGEKASRWIDEEEDIFRTSFQRDIGRILYSNPFRRLRTKTQVFTDPDDQHNRTRLTHSIEVSHIARQIARALCLNEDLVEAIALGHDLGHTPFGHAGERALNDMLKDKGGFAHNVQSVWLVENCYQGKLINGEAKTGLNLTYAVREGILKHTDIPEEVPIFCKKFYPDKPATPEGQVVDLSDGIAYLYHDIDDGIRNHLIEAEEIKELWEGETGLEYSRWLHYLINDVVQTSYDQSIVKLSESMKKAYKSIKKRVKERILLSSTVVEADKLGYEMVCEMFELLYKRPELIKWNYENERKLKLFGIERVIIDYIQWLGDQNFETMLEVHKKRI